MPRILAVCLSEKKGTRKEAENEGQIREDYGLEGDAHANSGSHRQVSLLAIESINKFQKEMGFSLNPGDFAENLTTEGIELWSLPITTRMEIGKEVVLEVTQIGKDCHRGCAILKQTGKCMGTPFLQPGKRDETARDRQR